MKKLKNYLICIIELIIISCHLQAQDWPKIYYDEIDATIRDLAEAYDKGYLLAGYTYNNEGWPQFDLITKIDNNGNVLWDKKFGNSSYSNGVSDFNLTNDNGMILAAGTSKYSGNYDPTFIKLNVCGELEWCKVFQSPDQNYGTGILQISDGSFIGMLQYYGEGETYARISLVKMDQTGEPIWINRLAQEDSLIKNEEGSYLYLTTDNNFLVSGWAYHPDSYPFWILTDTNGGQVWDLFWDSGYGEAHQVIEKDSGIFYSTSYAIGDNGIQSPMLFKFDKYGNLTGEYNLMGDTIFMGSCNPLVCLNDSSLVIGVGWKKVWLPIDEGFTEVFITDTLGNLINRRQLHNEYHSLKKIILSSDHKILAAGNFVVDGNWDIYLWKMNSDLEDDTLYTQPLTYDSLCPYEIQSDTVDLDCGVFVNIDELPTKEEYESTIKISPNPSREWIMLSLPDIRLSGNTEIKIYNLFGQEVMKTRTDLQNRTVSLNISGLSPGVYLVTCRDSRQRCLKGKFVIAG
jgi:hypothetical protein